MSVRKCKRKSKRGQPWNECYANYRNIFWVQMHDEWYDLVGTSTSVQFVETSFCEKTVLEESSVLSIIGSLPIKKDRRGRPPFAVNAADKISARQELSPEAIFLASSMSLMSSQSDSQPKKNVFPKGHAAVENNKLDDHKNYEKN